MDTRVLPDAIEPDYWNVVFHPSETRLARIVLGRFQHVSAFTYVPGFRAWLIYDVQWSGMRIALFSHDAAMAAFIHYSRGCSIVKFDRQYRHMGLLPRIGFFCVPAIKHLLGIDSLAMRPDALFKDCLKRGGVLISGQNSAASDQTRAIAGLAQG